MIPSFMRGNPVDPEALLSPVDVKLKKEMADVALTAARARGATYADVRIGRYLNQGVITREKRVQGFSIQNLMELASG